MTKIVIFENLDQNRYDSIFLNQNLDFQKFWEKSRIFDENIDQNT